MNPDTFNSNTARLDLSQLRDIHMPEPVSWWPPALGWWILLGLLLLALVCNWLIRRYRQRNAWRRDALAQLDEIHKQYQLDKYLPQQVVSELSVLLRRVAVSRFPREQSASLSGEKWLAFLEQACPEGISFQTESGRLLNIAPYASSSNISSNEVNSLLELCRSWIKKLPAGGQK